MGEAKRRKAADPSFGRLPKRGKGIIIAPETMVVLRAGSTPERPLPDRVNFGMRVDAEELRRGVLFWDQIVVPYNDIWRVPGNDAEFDFLRSEGILLEREFKPYREHGYTHELYGESFENAFVSLDKAEPGLWSLSGYAHRVVFEYGELFNKPSPLLTAEGRGALVELHNAIPLPKGDTPLADLLEFKAKYRDEIISLSLEIDGLFSKIASAGDSEFEFKRALREIEARGLDVIKAAGGSKIDFSLSGLSIDFSLNTDLLRLIGAGFSSVLQGTFGMTEIAALLGTSSSVGITVKSGASLKWRKGTHRESSPYGVIGELYGKLPAV